MNKVMSDEGAAAPLGHRFVDFGFGSLLHFALRCGTFLIRRWRLLCFDSVGKQASKSAIQLAK